MSGSPGDRTDKAGWLRAAFKRQPDRWLFLGLLVLIVWLPLPRGSNRMWAVSVFEIYVFALTAGWLLLFGLNKMAVSSSLRRAKPILYLWLAWLGIVLLQLLPLPADVVGWLSPEAASGWRHAAEFLGRPADWMPLTLVPDATRAHALETAAFLCLFALVVVTVRGAARRRVMAMTLVLSGLFQALYGTLFLLSGAEQGLFFDTAHRLDVATGTFVNRNHLAGYLEITSAVGVGLLLADLGQRALPNWRARLQYALDVLLSPAIRLRVFIALMVIALILTRSRTGNVAFFISLAVAGTTFMLLRERRLVFKSLFVFGTLFLVDLWLVGTWFGVEEVVQRLESTDASTEMRVAVWPGLVVMLEDFWLTGSGLGTFASVFPGYRPDAVWQFNDHAHNDYMQFLIEGGIGALLVAAIVALVAIHAFRVLLNRRDRLVCGMAFACLMAMLAIAIHSVTDFNLQIPANAATLIIVMGMTVACSPHSRQRSRESKQAHGKTPEAAGRHRAVAA